MKTLKTITGKHLAQNLFVLLFVFFVSCAKTNDDYVTSATSESGSADKMATIAFVSVSNYGTLPKSFDIVDGCVTLIGTITASAGPNINYTSQTTNTVTINGGVTVNKGTTYYICPSGQASPKYMKFKFKTATINISVQTFTYDWNGKVWTVNTTQNTDIHTEVSSLPLPC